MQTEDFLSDEFLKQFKTGQRLNDFLGQIQKRAIERMLNEYRPGNYGTGKGPEYKEKVRIDPGTPSGAKGPNDSHFHLDRGKEHITDPGRWPWWLNVGK